MRETSASTVETETIEMDRGIGHANAMLAQIRALLAAAMDGGEFAPCDVTRLTRAIYVHTTAHSSAGPSSDAAPCWMARPRARLPARPPTHPAGIGHARSGRCRHQASSSRKPPPATRPLGSRRAASGSPNGTRRTRQSRRGAPCGRRSSWAGVCGSVTDAPASQREHASREQGPCSGRRCALKDSTGPRRRAALPGVGTAA